MKLPSFLDFAYLLSALPHSSENLTALSEMEHEEFRLALAAPLPPGLPTKPLGYLLLVYLANEAIKKKTRELAGTLGSLCRSTGAPELAKEPEPVEDQLLRLVQTTVRIEVKGKKDERAVSFPLFSQLAFDPKGGGAKTKWHLRLSGDLYRVLKHTAPARLLASTEPQ
jgi:hypothetical protein